MADSTSTAQARLNQIKDFVTMSKTATTIPFDPDCTKFPSRRDVPPQSGAPPGAAWVWGKEDNVGYGTKDQCYWTLTPVIARPVESAYRNEG